MANICTLQIKVSQQQQESPRKWPVLLWLLASCLELLLVLKDCHVVAVYCLFPEEKGTNFISKCNGKRLIFTFVCLNVQCAPKAIGPVAHFYGFESITSFNWTTETAETASTVREARANYSNWNRKRKRYANPNWNLDCQRQSDSQGKIDWQKGSGNQQGSSASAAESWTKAISFSNWLTVIVKWIMAISMPVDAGNLAEAQQSRETWQKHLISYFSVPFNIYWARLRLSLLMTKVLSNELKNILCSALCSGPWPFVQYSINAEWDIKCFVFLINLWWLFKNVGNCKNNWDATFSLLLLLLLVYFCVVFFHFVFSWPDCDMCAYAELIDFCPKTNEILLKCSICTFCIRNAMGNQLKTITTTTTTANWLLNLCKHFSQQTFFAASENEFLVLFIFGKIKCAFILSPWQISCQKGGLVYFPNNFQIPLRNRNSSLDFDMRNCCSTERELW